MDQSGAVTAAGGRTGAPTRPCEKCGNAVSEHLLVLAGGKRVCSSCAAAMNDTSARTRLIRFGLLGLVAVLLIGGIVWLSNAHLAEKTQIAKSLVRLRAAALSQDPVNALVPYLDREATYNDLAAAAAAAGDPDPQAAVEAMWNSVITPAIQGGTVRSLENGRAVIRSSLNVQRWGEPTTFEVEYEMRNTDGETWRITRILNADEIYATFSAPAPAPAQ